MKLVFLFLSLISCSLNNTGDYLNKNLNLDYDENYSVEEYKKISSTSKRRGRATTYRVGSKNFKRTFSNMHGIEQ